MTEKSRVVLQDVRHAIIEHSKELQAESFRVSWISIVTLLRAIGHVLKNIDSNKSPELKQAIGEKWQHLLESKPEPKIFWEFIISERNRFLKNYEHSIKRTLTIPTQSRGKRIYIVQDIGNARGGKHFSPGIEIESKISSGYYKGQYEKDIATEAYNWWKNYLDDVDVLAEKYKNNT